MAKDTGGKCSLKKVFKNFFCKKIVQAISKNKGLKNFFSSDLRKKRSLKFFQAIYKILTIQKIVLSSRTGQFFEVKDFQNVSSRTPPLVFTEVYRFKMAHFRPVTFWSRDLVPPNSVCVNHLSAPTLCSNFSGAHHVVLEL